MKLHVLLSNETGIHQVKDDNMYQWEDNSDQTTFFYKICGNETGISQLEDGNMY